MENIHLDDARSLIYRINRGYQPSYLFFWGHTALKGGRIGKQCLSQWYPSPFRVENSEYATAEHYLMAEKARLFKDEQMRSKILLSATPREAKELGREVNGFDETIWSSNRVDFALRANLAKFSQNESIKEYLLGTNGKILAEASPYDIIWGIGMSEKDPRATNPRAWLGRNLLGFVLMEVRARLLEAPAVDL